MKQMSDILKNLTLLGQLGLSFLTPILLCLFVCMFLQTRFGAPLFIYISGFILGLGGSFMTAWKFYKAVENREKREENGKGGTKEDAGKRRKMSKGFSNQHW